MYSLHEILKVVEKINDIVARNKYIELNNDEVAWCEYSLTNRFTFDVKIQFDNNTKLCALVYSYNEVYIYIYNESDDVIKKYKYEKLDTNNLIIEIINKIHEYSKLFFNTHAKNN